MIVFNYLALLILVLTFLNTFTIKTLKPGIKPEKFDFEILIPMRNEESNVSPLLETVINQGGPVLVLDDNSTDQTFKKVSDFSNKLRLLKGKELPSGWLGKNFACHQLAINSEAEYLVFLDADVRLVEGSVSTAIKYMREKNWEFISPYPLQKSSGFLQFLIQPLLQWSWFASIPFFYAYRKPNKSMAVANGQFFIVRRDAYIAAGGHKAIKSEVLDDLELARSLIGAGYTGGPINGTFLATCHMYRTDREMINGYTKSLWRAFGSAPGTMLALFLLIATALPFFSISIGLFAILFSRLLVAIKVRSNIFSALFHPFSMIVLILLIIYSNYLHRFGNLSWKGREI